MSRPLTVAFITLLALLADARATSAGPPAPSTEGIEAILVADTLRGPSGTAEGQDRMEGFLQDVRAMGHDVRVTRLDGQGVTPGGVVGTIRRLDPARMANRTLLFYYAGHGGTDPKAGHFLRTPRGDLPRSTLLAEIRAKSPRLTLVLTDCCSTKATLKAPLVPAPSPPERRAVENLLFQHVGVVDVNASSSFPDRGVYQAAFYYPRGGGLFTIAFTSMFREPLDWLPKEGDEGFGAPGDDEQSHRRRFNAGELARYDRDKDGFIEWTEAREYLDASVMSLFEGYRLELRPGGSIAFASPADVRLLNAQISQDPHFFPPLAARSDRPAGAPAVEPGTQPARRSRLGATCIERYARGGAYLEIAQVDPRSPAAKVLLWRNGKRGKEPMSLRPGDTIVRANNVRIRRMTDLHRVLDSIREGGELNIAGYDARTGLETKYEVTAVLDRYE